MHIFLFRIQLHHLESISFGVLKTPIQPFREWHFAEIKHKFLKALNMCTSSHFDQFQILTLSRSMQNSSTYKYVT